MIDRHSVAIITALLATQLSAQCLQPQRPPVLDARTQSVDQFQANYQTAETYLAEADAFLRCIENTERTLAETGAADDSYDSDRKATFASNLMTVIASDSPTSPVVNVGTLNR